MVPDYNRLFTAKVLGATITVQNVRFSKITQRESLHKQKAMYKIILCMLSSKLTPALRVKKRPGFASKSNNRDRREKSSESAK